MKKITALLLVVCMLIGLTTGIYAAGEVRITSPSDGQWLDPYNDDIVIKWSKPASGQTCKITIVNVGENKDVIRNKPVSGTSYTIKAGTFGFEEKYKVWVGTFENGEAIGPGSSIIFCTKPKKECIEEASFANIDDGDWVDSTKTIAVRINDFNADLVHRITIKNAKTGEYITQNEIISSRTYNIPAYTLDYEEKYTIWIGTYTSKNLSDAVGKGNSVTVLVNAAELEEASITTPENEAVLPANTDITFKWENLDTWYSITLRDTTTNDLVFERKDINQASYTVDADDLTPGHSYKLWLGTYADERKEKIGIGDTITFSVEELPEEPEEPEIPEEPEPEEEPASFKNTKISMFDEESIEMRYELDDGAYSYVRIRVKSADGNTIHNDKYTKISDAVLLSLQNREEGKYSVSIQLFDAEDNVIDSATETLVYEIEKDEPKEEPAEIQSVKASVNNGTLVIKYTLSNDAFTTFQIDLYDANGEFVDRAYSSKLSGSVEFELGDSEEYTYYAQLLDDNGKVFEEESGKIKQEKKVASGFSVVEKIMLADRIPLGEKIEISGVVGSAYPIQTAVVTITDVADTSDVYAKYTDKNVDSERFDVSEAQSTINKENLGVGTYTLTVQVTDTEGESYTAFQKDFSVYKEAGVYPDVPKTHKNYTAIKALSESGVLSGYEDGTFRPENAVTRGEFVKIICEAFGLSKNGNGQDFDDSKNHWAKPYIQICSSKGLVNGVSATHFAPDETVTYQQMAKIVSILKGWESEAKNLGGWPDGYVRVMIEKELFDNTKVAGRTFTYSAYYDFHATRADVCQIVYNASEKDTNVPELIGKTWTEAELKEFMEDMYGEAMKLAKVNNFNGKCGACVGRQLQAIGVIKTYDGAHGKDTFDKYSAMQETSGGYSVTAFSVNEYSLSEIIEYMDKSNDSGTLTLLALGFQKGSKSETGGQKYGHTLLVYAVIDGVVYFTESDGQKIRTLTIEDFCNKYRQKEVDGKDTYVYEGAVLFTK